MGKLVNQLKKFWINIPNVSQGTPDTPLFTITGRYKAKVVKVTDGDTIHVVMMYNFRLCRFKVRLAGIDAPEMRGEEKKDGIISKMELCNVILNEIVEIDCEGFDNFGRLLATVYHDGFNVNKWLMEEDLAEVYSK